MTRRESERKTSRTDDRGVSVILGAMMLTGVLLMTYVTYQVSVAPKLDAGTEAEHNREVTQQLAQLKTDLDRHLSNSSGGATTNPISLGRSSSGVLSSANVGGALSFEPGEHAVRLDAKEILVKQLNNSQRITHPEGWSSVNGSSSPIEDVDQVVSLRLKIDRIAREFQGDHVAVKVTDADGDAAGQFRVCVANHSPDWDLHYVTTSADGDILYNNAQSYFNNQEYAPFWVNVMNPDYRFDQVLAVAKSPYDISVEVLGDAGEQASCPGDGDPGSGPDTLSASYAITYAQATSAGTIMKGTSGLVYENYNKTFASGSLSYSATSRHMGDQTYTFEHGALVLEQHEGDVFKLDPSFDAVLVDNTVSIEIALPTFKGDPSTVTGTGTGSVYSQLTNRYMLTGQATNFSINLTTEHPGLWTERWSSVLEGAGLTDGTGFTTDAGSGWARVDVWGLLHPDPTSDAYDLHVTFRQASIKATVQG